MATCAVAMVMIEAHAGNGQFWFSETLKPEFSAFKISKNFYSEEI